jgi:hypothetical protein
LYRHRRSLNKSKAWFEPDEGTLLRAEQALVQRDYSGLAFQIDSSSGRMHLIGAISPLSECGVATTYLPLDSAHTIFTEKTCRRSLLICWKPETTRRP